MKNFITPIIIGIIFFSLFNGIEEKKLANRMRYAQKSNKIITIACTNDNE